MSDVDAEAVMASYDSPQPPKVTGDSDADAVIHALEKPAAKKRDWLAGTPLGHFAAIGETALQGVTAGAGSLADAVTFAPPGTHDWAYHPRTTEGKALSGVVNKVGGQVTEDAAQLGGHFVGLASNPANAQAATDTLRERIPEALGAVGTVAGAGELVKSGVNAARPKVGDAQAAADAATAHQALGAASSKVDVSRLTPETQAHLAELDSKGAPANPIALANHAEAESLPVPVRYTRGQALENEAIKTQEYNSKQQQPEIGRRFDEQDEALQENLETFHREAAPTAVGNDIPKNDQVMIDSLKRYDAPKKQAITDAYQAAKDANGGDLQMDGSKFSEQAEAALKPQGKSRFLPSSVQGIIDDVKASGGKMSLDDFEGYRTALANESRKAQRAGDGNAVAAINKVRDVLEDTPPAGDSSAAAKAAYDKARGLAKARFDEMKNDPAYEAAVQDDTPAGQLSDQAGKFGNKYVLNGVKANLQRLRAKLDPEGQEAMTSAGYGVLQDKAGIAKGKFVQNGYNTALNSMRTKGIAEELLGGADNVEDAAKLGRVARKAQTFSRGAAPNTSGTLTGALAKEGVGVIRKVLPEGVNKGVDVLGGQLAKRAAAKNLYETLRPGAGLAD